MINQILQDSSVINQTEKYHLIHLSLNEVGNFILNCNEFDKIKFLTEKNKATFEITGRTHDKLMEFIRENKDKTNWGTISWKQKLSEEFICEFQDQVDWCWIFSEQKLSREFRKEFAYKLKG